MRGPNSRSAQSVSNRRVRGLASESQGLDRTLDLTSEIMSVGSAASAQLDGQTGRLRNTNSTLKKLEETVPGAEKLISLISKHEKKNTIILAFVISVCLVITLYSLGVIHFLKKLVNVMPSVSSSATNDSEPKIDEQ